MKLKRSAAALAAVLMTSAGMAHATIINAYEDVSLGPSWPYSVSFNITGPDAVSIDIQTLSFANVIPIHKLFETDGQGGALVLTETITNTGATAWSGWSEALWEEYPGLYAPGTPGPGVAWDGGSLSASVGGAFNLNATTGELDFSFATPLSGGQSFTLSKTILYDAGVLVIGAAEAPAAVPVPAALPLLLSGLAGLIGVGRKTTTHYSEDKQ